MSVNKNVIKTETNNDETAFGYQLQCDPVLQEFNEQEISSSGINRLCEILEESKICNTCPNPTLKPLSEFGVRHIRGKSVPNSNCKQCCRKRDRARREKVKLSVSAVVNLDCQHVSEPASEPASESASEIDNIDNKDIRQRISDIVHTPEEINQDLMIPAVDAARVLGVKIESLPMIVWHHREQTGLAFPGYFKSGTSLFFSIKGLYLYKILTLMNLHDRHEEKLKSIIMDNRAFGFLPPNEIISLINAEIGNRFQRFLISICLPPTSTEALSLAAKLNYDFSTSIATFVKNWPHLFSKIRLDENYLPGKKIKVPRTLTEEQVKQLNIALGQLQANNIAEAKHILDGFGKYAINGGLTKWFFDVNGVAALVERECVALGF